MFILAFKTNTLQKCPIVDFSVDVNLNVVDTHQTENAVKNKQIQIFCHVFLHLCFCPIGIAFYKVCKSPFETAEK